ncbi:pH-dependent sodium/proton antiporter [Legionella waltersii]|uniref:pH-dependent sodium/proton antiporter n=1 Tax=Legionella waltersii TaxID=66969 RepID=A0A0W1ADB6_9GAMM|nr:pH-dependent sodium/proton antiporter [Legionella waltersii]SNV13064.1 sodium-proton antiporter [Legionella waltersii]
MIIIRYTFLQYSLKRNNRPLSEPQLLHLYLQIPAIKLNLNPNRFLRLLYRSAMILKRLIIPMTFSFKIRLLESSRFFFNTHNPVYLKGWAIPIATDISFTLGIISFLRSRVPFSHKILLTVIAIFDDIAVIVIIALFYTKKLSLLSPSLAFLFTLSLIGQDLRKTPISLLKELFNSVI